ncbi:MAG: hypothetical protein CVU39_27440 [Chloroflexi bacterium HGW-Chloroflexi-10]|nr:MAG: hypothetical protein CVU39_27440 [Chloroflexi bacterium HGW-Chloroflexi-10]
MATSEERMRILKMIQDGAISAEDGIRLLDSIDQSEKRDARGETEVETGRTARFFRVSVTDTQTGKARVNVRLPVSVINAGIKMGARFSPEVEGLNHQELLQFIRSGTIGKIVDVYDEKDGEHVEVFLE